MPREWFTADELLPVAAPWLPASAAGLAQHIRDAGWQADGSRARVRFGRGGGYEYHVSLLPMPVRAALLRGDEDAVRAAAEAPSNAVRSGRWAAFDALPERAKARATERLIAVQAVISAGPDVTRHTAVQRTAAAHGVAASSLWGWLARVDGLDPADWLPVLADQRGGPAADDPRRAAIPADAWDYFLAAYLSPERRGLEHAYRLTVAAATAHGWGVLPSQKTFARRLRSDVAPGAVTLARNGREAARRMAPAQRRDRTVFASLEAVNADGYKHNVFVRWPDGSVGRPISIAFQDLRSGKWVARRTDRSENKEAVRLCFADLITRYGIPEHVYFDNGRHFASKWLTGRMAFRFRFKVKDEEPEGIITRLGTQVHFTTPYRGQSKPIERSFRDIGESLDKHPQLAGAYTGNRPDAKPENYGSAAVPLDLFEQVAASVVAEHNAREGRRGYGMEGRSFDQVFEAAMPELGLRRATAEQRRLFLLAAEGVTARKPDGRIELFDNRFWADALAGHVGERLIVRFDPQELGAGIAVYSLDNRFLCEAERLDDVGFNSVEDAREAARLQAQMLRNNREALDLARRLDAADLKRLTPLAAPEAEPDPAARKVVRLAAGGGGRAAAASLDFAALGAALERLSGDPIPFPAERGQPRRP
jgi:hypothetical protein